jgi:hypothetical protein
MSDGYTFRPIGSGARAMGEHARPYSDLHLYCAICDEGFVYAASERELAQTRGIELQPKLCPDCRRLRWHRS